MSHSYLDFKLCLKGHGLACRLHKLVLQPTTFLDDLIPVVKAADVALVGAAGGAPVQSLMQRQANPCCVAYCYQLLRCQCCIGLIGR